MTHERITVTSSLLKAYFICFCAALFYIYQFVLRVAPSVMVDEIMLTFHLDAASFAFLSASAMYTYSLMQIPAGIFADKYGVRACVLLSLFFCSIGALCFSLIDNYWLALLSRMLIGAGSACAFLCMTKIAINWFGVRWQARIFGIAMTAGTIGALNGSIPIAYLLETTTWNGVFMILSVIGMMIWGLNYFFLKEKQEISMTLTEKKSSISFQSIKLILQKPACWLNAIAALGIYACVSVVADLWGVSFCMQAFELSRPKAAELTSLIYVGLCVGSIVIPFICDYGLGRKKFILAGLFIIICCLAQFAFGENLSIFNISVLLIIIGFFAGTEMLCFTNACEAVLPSIAGTTTGFVNCIVMLGGSLLQNFFGLVMNHSWQGKVDASNEPIYGMYEYRSGFLLIISCLIISLIVATLIPSDHQAQKLSGEFK